MSVYRYSIFSKSLDATTDFFPVILSSLSVVFSDVPVVDRAICIARRQHLDVAICIFHVGLAVIDVVLMEGILWLHHSVLIELCTIKEDSPATEGIIDDFGFLFTPEAWIQTALKFPGAITLLFEGEGDVVETTADISVFRDEAASQDGVAAVNNALSRWLLLAADLLRCEFSEVHLAVVSYRVEIRL